MNDAFIDIMNSLSATQKTAVQWQEGSALVLAGPGAGKTRVLTARIARLLNESRDKRFRVLALTFTTKAAREMRERVELLVPDLIERAEVTNFHSFCAQVLQHHGSHIGVKPDFGIYDQKADREALLVDALRRAIADGGEFSLGDKRLLENIEELRKRLIIPERTAQQFQNQAYGSHVASVYKLYEEALRAANALDFDGLILEASRLVYKTPVVAERLRRTYPYWLIDEFQDTTPAQYRFLKYLGGDTFKNIFCVGDDDQVIYQWAGASYRQIAQFRVEYKSVLLQLIENHRCPPDVVEAANKLVAHNRERTDSKIATVATRPMEGSSISLRCYADDAEERSGIAKEILDAGREKWSNIAVLARTKAVLASMLQELRSQGVNATIAERRDRFQTPQFAWLQAAMSQAVRPADRQVFRAMLGAAERLCPLNLDEAVLEAEANALGVSPGEVWWNHAQGREGLSQLLGQTLKSLSSDRRKWRAIASSVITQFAAAAETQASTDDDLAEDMAAWDDGLRDLRAEKGSELELAEVVQGLAMRSKEPPKPNGTVVLMTIHGAKGLEFDSVYVVGLAESVLPSFQSVKAGDTSIEMEEERRNCFVAITRTRERLILSRAEIYRGYPKEPSRFLSEMGVLEKNE